MGNALHEPEEPQAMRPQLTKAQRDALLWFAEHNGDGVFDRSGVLLAAGELAPVMRSTWNKLAAVGLVEFYNPIGRGRGRLRLIQGPK
jgi:hypothetical protein